MLGKLKHKACLDISGGRHSGIIQVQSMLEQLRWKACCNKSGGIELGRRHVGSLLYKHIFSAQISHGWLGPEVWWAHLVAFRPVVGEKKRKWFWHCLQPSPPLSPQALSFKGNILT